MLSPLTRQLYYLATSYDNHYPDLLSQVSRYRSRWEPQYHLSLTPSSSSTNPAHVNAKSRANPCGTLYQSRNAIMKLEAGRGSVTLVEIGAYARPKFMHHSQGWFLRIGRMEGGKPRNGERLNKAFCATSIPQRRGLIVYVRDLLSKRSRILSRWASHVCFANIMSFEALPTLTEPGFVIAARSIRKNTAYNWFLH